MNAKITFPELVELMAKATSTTQRMCDLFVRELFATVSQTLINGESVKIKGIGTFKVTTVKPRKSVSVNTGEAKEIASYNKLTFIPEKSLADAVNQPFAQFETVFLADEVTDEKLAEIDEQFTTAVSEDDGMDSVTVDTSIAVEDSMPEQPDMPVAPPPTDLPPLQEDGPKPVIPKEFVEMVSKEEKRQASIKTDKKPAPEEPHKEKPLAPVAPAADKDIKHEETIAEKPVEPAPEPIKRKPMLVGRPIDGPSQPVPREEKPEEPKEDRRFYRPEPRNVYTPTEEQIEEASRKPNRNWLWILLSLLAASLLFWLIARGCNANKAEQHEMEVVAADTIPDDQDSVEVSKATEKPDVKAETKPEVKPEPKEEVKPEPKVEPKPEVKQEPKPEPEQKPEAEPASKPKVVTDVVTSQIVLTTLAEKHYGSPWFWVYIYEENRDIISNPNNIKPGTRVVIPPASKYGINPKDKASLKKAQIKSMEYLKKY